jgi:membrane protease YdiL (CAAX protease family)
MYVQGQVAILTILFTLSAYLLYFLISRFHPFGKESTPGPTKQKTTIHEALFQRCSGIVLYGIIPAILVLVVFPENPFHYGLSFANLIPSLHWILGLSAAIIPISVLNIWDLSPHPEKPLNRAMEGSPALHFVSAGLWILYLLGYEFLLRGILFFSCLNEFGLWPAVAVNVLMYAVLHLHKDQKEIIGSLFLGFVFCIATFQTKTIWAAYFTHTILALSYEWASHHSNTDVQIKWIQNRK